MKSWISRVWEMLRSALSWTHWRQKKLQRQWEMQQLLLLELRLQQRMLLMEALAPMAEALQRMDSLQQQQWQQTHLHLMTQEDLLKEVLNSLMPLVEQQIFPLIGQPIPPIIYPSSGN